MNEKDKKIKELERKVAGLREEIEITKKQLYQINGQLIKCGIRNHELEDTIEYWKGVCDRKYWEIKKLKELKNNLEIVLGRCCCVISEYERTYKSLLDENISTKKRIQKARMYLLYGMTFSLRLRFIFAPKKFRRLIENIYQ